MLRGEFLLSVGVALLILRLIYKGESHFFFLFLFMVKKQLAYKGSTVRRDEKISDKAEREEAATGLLAGSENCSPDN